MQRREAEAGTAASVASKRLAIYKWLEKNGFKLNPQTHKELRALLKDLCRAAAEKEIFAADTARHERDLLASDFYKLLRKKGFKNKNEAGL